jgi:hypothetical protein
MKNLAFLTGVGILALAVSTPALSQTKKSPLATSFASDSLTVPVMVNAGGLAGATFGTYVALFNPTSRDFDVFVTLYDAAGIAYHATIPVQAGQLYTYANFLDHVFHFSGAGTVKFQSGAAVGGSSDNLFILSAEVYTNASGVRYGTSLPAFDFPGTDSRSFSAGITVDAHNRANVGCFNESGDANTVNATVFDGFGHQASSVQLHLGAHAWGQTGLPVDVSGGYVQFDPSAPADCYAVVVNNTTNDGRVIAAVEYTP